jgi:hypothetical protein
VTGSGGSFTIEVGPRYSAADIFSATVTLPEMDGERVAAATITVSNALAGPTANAVSPTELGCYSGLVAALVPAAGPGGSSFVAALGWGAGLDHNGLQR